MQHGHLAIIPFLPDNYAQRPKRGDEDGRRKHVGHEISYLTDQHCEVSSMSIISAIYLEERADQRNQEHTSNHPNPP